MSRPLRFLKNKGFYWIIIFLLVSLYPQPSYLREVNRITIGKFVPGDGEEANGSPKGWKTLTFFNIPPTEYQVVKYRGEYVLKAHGIGTSSCLFREVKAELGSFPIISWKWKISNVIRQAIETQKDRNDSAARVIVVFEPVPEEMPPWYRLEYLLKGIIWKNAPLGPRIEYIWGNKIEKGRIFENPSVGGSKMIILESGERKANRWIREKRNLVDDYRSAFGAEPQGIVALGIQTDTDQSNEGVTAYYGEIVLNTK